MSRVESVTWPVVDHRVRHSELLRVSSLLQLFLFLVKPLSLNFEWALEPSVSWVDELSDAFSGVFELFPLVWVASFSVSFSLEVADGLRLTQLDVVYSLVLRVGLLDALVAVAAVSGHVLGSCVI